MERSSPTVEGFRVMFTRPAFGLAEVTWRWSFGLAAWLLLALSLAEYLDSLTVSRTDLFLLRTRQPALILRALLDIFRGSGVRLVQGFVLLAVSLTVLWIVTAALARAATVKALIGHFRGGEASRQGECSPRWSMRALWGLNFFRVAAFLAAIMACLAPILALGAFREDVSPGTGVLVIAGVVLLVGWAWSVVNWFLSLAGLFVVRSGEDTFGAMGAAIDLCRDRPGAVFAVGTWFGLAHLGAFTIATFLALFSVGLVRALPANVGFVGVLLVTLLYFGVADFLYIGRLAAYLAILELPALLSPETVAPPRPGGVQFSATVQPGAIDRDELILSDLPAPT
jgi:hypothetical protein